MINLIVYIPIKGQAAGSGSFEVYNLSGSLTGTYNTLAGALSAPDTTDGCTIKVTADCPIAETEITKSIKLTSGITHSSILRQAGAAGSLLKIDSGKTLEILELTVDGAPATPSDCTGSLVYVDSGAQFILDDHAILQNNRAAIGGGIYNAGSVTLNGGTVIGNTAVSLTGKGGGIYNSGTLVLNSGGIINNTVEGTDGTQITSSFGGGIYNDHGGITINGGSISHNTAAHATIGGQYSYGGATYSIGGSVTLSSGTVAQNNSDLGAGFFLESGTVFSMNGGTIAGNGSGSTVNGGGIYNNFGGTARILSGSITDNYGGNGGGIYNNGTLDVNRSVISQNHNQWSATDVFAPAGTVTEILTDAAAPIITVQPPPTVLVSQNVPMSLSVTATGLSLSYQWYKQSGNVNGQPIPGETGNTYAPPTSAVGTTDYYCVVTNTDSSATGNKTAAATTNICSVTVTAPPPPVLLTSISVTRQPDKVQYIKNQNFDPTGMVVTANYSDGSSATVTNYTISPQLLTVAGAQDLTVSYTEGAVTATASVPVTVSPPPPPVYLTSISVTRPPDKVLYTQNQSFDPTGMVVTAYYSDGSSAAITNYTVTPQLLTVSGLHAITVSYTEGAVMAKSSVLVKVFAPPPVPPGSSVSPVTPIPPSSALHISYSAHIQHFGWEKKAAVDGKQSGTTHMSLRLEAVKITLAHAPVNAHVTYQAWVRGKGWMRPVSDGAQAGTTHQRRSMQQIRMTISGLSGYKIAYRVHIQKIGWQDWRIVQNGTDINKAAVAGTSGKNLRIEAIEIKLLNLNRNDLCFQHPLLSYNNSLIYWNIFFEIKL